LNREPARVSGESSGARASVLTYTLTLAAPPERVFAALTEARDLEHWFCDRCTSEPGAGGRLVMRWERAAAPGPAYEARWLVWNPPDPARPGARVSFRGGHAGYPNGDAGTISFGLTSDLAGTRLALLHEIPPGDAFAPLRREWEQAWPRALARLEKLLSPPPPHR
jgi:uncharacterized protein YndB with AHSA1/START domain